MSRIKVGIFGAVAALMLVVVGIVGAATANAAFTLTTKACTGGTQIIVCYTSGTSKLEFEGEEEFEILPAESLLTATLGGEKVEILAGAVKAKVGLIVQTSPLSANASIITELSFENSKLLGTLGEKCKVPATINTVPLVGTPSTAEDTVFTPKEGTTFANIKFEENKGCPATIKGEKKVKGKQLCTFPNFATASEEQLIVCGKSELELAEAPATFELDANIFLTNVKATDPWYISSEG